MNNIQFSNHNKKYTNFEQLSYPAKKAIDLIEEMDINGNLKELNKIMLLLEKIKNKCCIK